MAETSDNLTNMERYYESQADAAVEAFNKGKWETCDTICTELLAIPALPSLWRAQCNLLLATTGENTAISFAKEAVKWYNKCLENGGDDEYLKKMRGEAELIIKAAEEKKAAEQSEDKVAESKEEPVGEDGSPAEPADDGKESINQPALAEEDENGKE